MKIYFGPLWARRSYILKKKMKWNLLWCGMMCVCVCICAASTRWLLNTKQMGARGSVQWDPGSHIKPILGWLPSGHCFAVTTLSVPLAPVGAVSAKHRPNHCVTLEVPSSIFAVGLCLSTGFNYHPSASISVQEETRNYTEQLEKANAMLCNELEK